jgi:PAS domain S-box-containing protein
MGSSGYDLGAKLHEVVNHPERHYSNENENMRRNGERVWVAWTNKAIYGHDGKLNEVLCIGIDCTEQKGTEKALKASEERFRAIFEHAPVGITMLDATGRFLQSNPAFQVIVGYSAAELQGLTYPQITHPEDLSGNLLMQEDLLAGKYQRYSIEKRYLRKDGEIVWVSMMVSHLANAQGESQVVATVIDITARKRAEEELAKNHLELQETSQRLKQSRNMLELIIESIPVRVFWKDSDLRYLGCNSLFARDAGFTDPHQLIGNDDFAMGWRDQADLYQADDRQVIESRRPKMNYVEPQTTPAGTEIWLKTSKVPLQMQDAEAVGILGVYEDITEFKRAEEALRKSEQRFRLMAETIQDVFWIATSGIEKTTYVSPRYEQVWGRPRKELYQSSQTFLEAVHPEDRQRVKSETFVAHDRGESFNLEYRIIRSDGEVRWIQDRGFPVLNEQGDIILFTGVATDITERKSLEKQLLLAQKMEAVGRLAGGVAHDFNNLLMAISGYGELMRATVLKSDPLYGYLEDILKTTDRAAALTGQLLIFSRQQIVNPQVVDLNLVVLDLERMLKRLIEADIELQIITAPGLGAVQADPGYLHQIIMNLVVNARDAMPRGGRIVVETATVDFDTIRQTKSGLAPSGPYVMLLVTDNGVGMDEAIQTHIFEPFFTTKERGKGTGLGLSTVYGIVKQSGGFIDLESVPGEGNTFTVDLPRLG